MEDRVVVHKLLSSYLRYFLQSCACMLCAAYMESIMHVVLCSMYGRISRIRFLICTVLNTFLLILHEIFARHESHLENDFRCPWSGTTLKPHKSIVFYALRKNLLVVTRTNLQFFHISCLKVQTFHSFEIRFRHFVFKTSCYFIFCISSSLLAQKSKQKANSLPGGKSVAFVIKKCHL